MVTATLREMLLGKAKTLHESVACLERHLAWLQPPLNVHTWP